MQRNCTTHLVCLGASRINTWKWLLQLQDWLSYQWSCNHRLYHWHSSRRWKKYRTSIMIQLIEEDGQKSPYDGMTESQKYFVKVWDP